MTRQQELGLICVEVPFEGGYRTEMFELRQAGLTPWSTEDVMDVRNEVNLSYPLWNNFFDTDFGIAGTEKKVYVIPHSPNLRALKPNTSLTSGGLPLEVDGSVKVYNRKDVILGGDLDEDRARKHPLWLEFAGGDKDRLDLYVERTFRFVKNKFGYHTMMGIFVPIEKQPIERAVMLGVLGGGSRANGDYSIDSYARFVGVRRGESAPEAHAPKKSPYREDPVQI